MPITDGIEIAGYIFGFWFFVFNKNFRRSWIENFQKHDKKLKFLDLIEAASAIFLGVVTPIWLITYLLSISTAV